MTIETFSDRLKIIIDDRKTREFSRRSGLSETVLRKYLSGDSTPNVPRLEAIAKTANVSVEWLVTGDKNQNSEQSMDEFALVPRYDVMVSAGNGYTIHSEQIVDSLAFKRSWLKANGHKPDSLILIEVRGDSMEPKLYAGDLVLVDQDKNQLIDGKTYVIRMDNELMVKSLQKLPGNRIQISSINPTYHPFTIEESKIEYDISIIGQVISHTHEWG